MCYNRRDMDLKPFERSDLELIDAAKATIEKFFCPTKHVVGAAIRTGEGHIVTAVHLEAFVGRMAVCAEAVALGKAISDGHRGFVKIVAVCHPDRVVSPCGMCRELLLDYCPEIEVILPGGICTMKELLPMKFAR